MRARVLSLLVCLLLVPLASLADILDEAGYHLLIGRLFADEGREKEASESFGRAIELAPEDPYLRLEYARFLVRQRRLARALDQITTAYRLAPEEPDVLRLYAETQLKRVDEDPAALSSAREALEKLRQLRPEDVESMISLGQIYLSEQSPDEAADVFQEVLDRTSGNRMVYRLLVDALVRAGQNDRAEDTLREALDVDPEFTRARLVLSEMLGQQGRSAEAIEVLSAAPEPDLANPELQRRLALELHRAGDFESALAAVDRVLEQEPGDYPAMYLKAVILSALGENQAATDLARRLLALHPDRTDVVVLLADLLVRQGRWQDADQELQRVEEQLRLGRERQEVLRILAQRAVILSRAEAWQDLAEALEPHLPELEDARQFDLIFLYAEAQARSGDTGKAMAMLSRFGADSQVASAAVAKQAEIFFTLGDEEEAKRRIEELTSSADFDDLMLAAEVFQRLEKYDEAIPILERALAVRADSIQAMFWLGASYERTDRRSEATSMLENLLEVSPDFAPALNYLGYMWAERGENLDRALELVQRAVALEPDNGAYVDSLGWAYFQLGRYEEAREYLERAAGLVGDDAVVFEHLGDLYRALGLPDRAGEAYGRALDLQAENADSVQQKLDELDSGD